MTPRIFLKKTILSALLIVSVCGAAFAGNGYIINEKLLQNFKQTFPDAQQVKWLEQADKYTVNFTENGILTKIDYDKEGNFMSSLRYYSEKNLPVNILVKLQKKYADKKVFGVTELTTDTVVDYYIKLEDDRNWITVRSNADGNMQVVEKYKKV
jgi:hypothetical protein